jgi:hypothetical protein
MDILKRLTLNVAWADLTLHLIEHRGQSRHN